MTNKLAIGAGVVALLTASTFAGLGFTWTSDNTILGVPATLAVRVLGLIPVAASLAVIWSSWKSGRLWWVGLGLAIVYLAISVSPPLFAVVIHLHGPLALLIVFLAIVNFALLKEQAATETPSHPDAP